MAFERPSLTELIQRVTADTKSRLSVPQLRRSNAEVYSRVMAGASHSMHGHIAWLGRQLFVDTAESEYLDRWASIYDIRRKTATTALGSVTFSFSKSVVDVPVGTLLQSDDGIQYETLTGVAPDGKASVGAILAGVSGNLESGDVLHLMSPIAGVLSDVTCNGISGGADQEDDESLRTRLLMRMQEQPHGGSKTDWVQWCLEVPGVTRAWCYPVEDGAGTVTVRFVCDDNADGIVPDEEMLRQVEEYLETKRPVTAAVTVSAPTLKPVNITIDALDPDTTDVKAAVEAELKDLFQRESVPGGAVLVSHIRAAISYAVSETDHVLISPTENPTAKKNELLTLGVITWQ